MRPRWVATNIVDSPIPLSIRRLPMDTGVGACHAPLPTALGWRRWSVDGMRPRWVATNIVGSPIPLSRRWVADGHGEEPRMLPFSVAMEKGRGDEANPAPLARAQGEGLGVRVFKQFRRGCVAR